MSGQDNRIDRVRPDAPSLAGYGPHAVGVRRLDLVNRAQVDVMAALSGVQRTYDRPIVVETWYPAEVGNGHVEPYDTLLRDGRTPVQLHGRAARGAAALAGDFPLVVLSHGFPGNRMLMAHLGETLASRGFIVAALDHADSTYGDAAYLTGQAFGSTLVNRSLDTGFVIGALGATRAAIVGYSMGGYGALVSGGASVARAALMLERAGPVAELWEQHCAAVADPRLKAIVTFGPWGRQMGLWDAAGMAGLSVPLLVVAGSQDAVSGYETGMRPIFAEAVAVERHLLTFQNAGHNAGAPIPAPVESWDRVPGLEFAPFDHYADPVWDSVRMNNIAQHAVAGFLARYLQGAAVDLALALPGVTWESLMPGQAG